VTDGDQRRLLALHEAGHLVAGQELGLEPSGALIRADSGYCLWRSAPDPAIDLTATLAGEIAEQLEQGRDDWRDAGWLRLVARREYRHYPDTDNPADLADLVLLEAADLAATILDRCWTRVVRTADELLSRGVVDGRIAA
jgi:hypothetical protein